VSRDWRVWHEAYDRPGSALNRRLRIVQGHLATWLSDRAGRPSTVVSACAGQGRDLLEVLASEGARTVRVRLVELDPSNAAVARRYAADAGLDVEVVCGDAGTTDAYAGAVPADLVLMCGVFGNVSDEDVRRTVGALPGLCATGATVVWTRSRRGPDLTPAIRGWFAEAGFEERAFDAPDDALFTVGVHVLAGEPTPLVPGVRLFSFTAAP
jgi:hypothetical protein